MRSIFYGLEIASSGLRAAQANLQITAHNIANANTEGYTRQQVVQTSIEPGWSGMFGSHGSNNIGGGVDIQEIRQIRSQYVDLQYRKEQTGLGEWETKRDLFAYVEAIFNEPSESGINSVMNEFFNSLQALSMNPEDPTTRSNVQQTALALTETIRGVYTQLEQLQIEADSSIVNYAGEINSYGREIAELNRRIAKFEVSGNKANDLRDQRNLLVDRLSKIVNISVHEDNFGRFRVDIGGQILVSNTDFNEVTVVRRSNSSGSQYSQNNNTDVPGLVEVVWKDTEERVNITGGILKGYMDMRDGIGEPEEGDPPPPNMNREFGIPYYMKQWNKLANVLITRFNEVHREGYALSVDASGNALTDIPFFQVPLDEDGNPEEPAAKHIDISDEVRDDWDNIAAIYLDQSDIDEGITPEEARGNNKNVLRLIELFEQSQDPEVGSITNFAKALVSGLGVSSRQANHMAESQEVLAREIETRRQSLSGVSLDEEMSNMVKFQHAYNAAARIVTSIDQMMDTIINRMGVAGR